MLLFAVLVVAVCSLTAEGNGEEESIVELEASSSVSASGAMTKKPKISLGSSS